MESDVDVILVGGACVSIYTHNEYQSYDLDLISYESSNKIKKALDKIGFIFNKNKTFTHENCEYFIEFVTPPITVGNEIVKKFNLIESEHGSIKLLRPEDCIKDRLSAYFYWSDLQSLDQAIMVAHSQNVDFKEIESWATKENQTVKFSEFKSKVKPNKD